MTVYLGLAGLVVIGGAVTGFVMTRDVQEPLPDIVNGPVPNRDGKTDQLRAARPRWIDLGTSAPSAPEEISTRAFGSAGPSLDPQSDALGPPAEPIDNPPLPVPRPKSADLPPVQTSYTLLSDRQIAAIKDRLRMSDAQAKHWPPVEAALRDLARKMHTTRQATLESAPATLSAADAQQLQSAATPLLRVLREDQKREVRALARIIGLDVVASRI
jgi:hypothetical protein